MEECKGAFVNDMKQLQISFACPLLKRLLWLVCDSSPYGVGWVIPNSIENGEDKRNAFASGSHTAS